MNKLIRPVAALLAIAFTGMIVWASFRGDIGAEFGAISAMPWGQVSLVDLYLGFLLYFAAVFVVEQKMSVKLLWAVPVFVLGNAWALIWVAVRWDVILARLNIKHN
jgi:hypothetical protein